MKNFIRSVFFVFISAAFSFAGESRIELVTIQSSALGIAKRFNVYLPEDYDLGADRYPVVYLFRGHENEWVNPNEDASRGGRNIKDVADELYRAGLIGKMILVMPGLSSDDNTIPGLGVNFRSVSLAGGKSGIGTGRFEDFMIDDLIAFVDQNFRTLPFRQHRGVDGFSLGGYTAIMLAAKHPELFTSAGSYDGTLMWLDFDDPRRPGTNDDFTWLTTSLFDPAFGLPRDLPYMLQYNMANLIQEATGERREQLLAIRFMLHSAGSEQLGNFDRSLHIVNLLAAQGITNAFADIRLSPNAEHNWRNADQHMSLTLPLHWAAFQAPVTTVPVEILSPVAGNEVSGMVEIRWSLGRQLENAITTLAYSRDAGESWQSFATLSANDTTFVWDTTQIPDGTRYLLRVFVRGENLLGVGETSERFTVNNPGNVLPEIELLSPSGGETISGDWPMQWFVDDADNDTLTLAMDYSTDGGATWLPLFRNLQNQNEYVWNSRLAPNRAAYRVILRAWDGTQEITDTSGVFAVFNQRVPIPAAQITHVAGKGGGTIIPNIVDPNLLAGNLYRVTFDDTSLSHKVYNVLNVDSGRWVVQNAPELDGVSEGPLFEGLRLLVKDFAPAEVDHAHTGWSIGASPWRAFITVPELSLGFEIIKGYPHPADYKIALFGSIVDTSISAYGLPAVPVYFQVWNLTEDRRADIIFIERVRDGRISRDDRILILEPGENGEARVTWSIVFSGSPNDNAPQPGDEFIFRTLKPFTSEDVYEFRATPTAVRENRAASSPSTLTLFQNYPNPFNPATTIGYALPRSGRISIAIYNLLGQRIAVLFDGWQAAGKHAMKWEGRDEAGKMVGSGVYFYHLEIERESLTGKLILMR